MYLCAGGFGPKDWHKSERYDPRTNTWSEIPSMRKGRIFFATAVMDDKIFAIGGYGSNGRADFFDKKANKWFVCLFVCYF
jgi:hypothetical protein